MNPREDELEAFKSRIPLAAYAASQGYVFDRSKSSRNCRAMKHRINGDRIVVAVGHDGHWVYKSWHDENDKGSIIDFCDRRGVGNIGHIRKELRPWLNRPVNPPAPLDDALLKKPEPITKDLLAIQAQYAATEAVSDLGGSHPYLNENRHLTRALLAEERFSGRVRVDQRGNALFPHWNAEGVVCGWELKNDGFTSFAKQGAKGLWGSRGKEGDTRLVISETSIDALSYAQLFGFEGTRFVSTAGQMNREQPALLNSAIRKMPEGSVIIAAVDNDDGGRKIADAIEPIFEHVRKTLEREDLTFKVHMPDQLGADWNDVLRDQTTTANSPNPPTPEPSDY